MLIYKLKNELVSSCQMSILHLNLIRLPHLEIFDSYVLLQMYFCNMSRYLKLTAVYECIGTNIFCVFVQDYLPSSLPKPTRTHALLKPRTKKLNYIKFTIYCSRKISYLKLIRPTKQNCLISLNYKIPYFQISVIFEVQSNLNYDLSSLVEASLHK